MHENNSQLFWGMFIEPCSHFLISPRPFKRVCIKLIVLWPSRIEMIDQCLAASPGLALEVPQGERMIEQFSLVEPGGMDRGETRPPPGVIVEIALRGLGGMAGVTILNQEHTAQMSMATAESTQSANYSGPRLYALGSTPPFCHCGRSKKPGN